VSHEGPLGTRNVIVTQPRARERRGPGRCLLYLDEYTSPSGRVRSGKAIRDVTLIARENVGN
jgi:hypothetical protein